MKVKTLLSLLACLPMVVAAQDTFDSVLEGNRTWLMCSPQSQTGQPVQCEETRLGLSMDVDGITVRQENRRQCLSDGTPAGAWLPTETWIGESNGLVVRLNLDLNGKEPMVQAVMNFSMQVGDMMDLMGNGDENDVVVATAVTDTIIDSSTDGAVRRCIHVHGIVNAELDDVWVEGIGSLKHGIRGTWTAKTAATELLRCSKGDDILYQSAALVPTQISPVTATVTPTSSAVYDLHGRRVKGQPTHGIYIQQGRKHVVK